MEVCRAAREFRKRIYDLIKLLPDEERYNLAAQMRRAATSLTNNIAEGRGRFHCQESIQFSRQARGSLSELIDDLNISIDKKYLPEHELNALKLKAYEVNRILNGFIAYLKKRKDADD